ncbi:hypothetical protein PAEAM_28870 [Paenibacillus sp. GM1FR]|uniref:hypothetical protein n=1 Tax=Paenibacillus sp. GM1FR TaxID=2059267 RepID=UPI000C27A5BA|nr:hypothetical protein [Paenibacillus sp. GM1FR]PJN59852.1 hypothetical protein PAEAM_28870 [Paenibacillus sp. GM1FR]
MTKLLLRNREIKSVFQLLGHHENDITYSVAWGLAQCPSFLRLLLQKIINWSGDLTEVEITMQGYEKNQGYTDIEIKLQGHFHLIIEAKRGWNLPDIAQLQKYVNRESFKNSPCMLKKIVVLSECSKTYLESQLPSVIDKISLDALSWKNIHELSETAQKTGTHAEKRLLRELNQYLGSLMTMQKRDSNLVYVVSIGAGSPEGWSITWREIVTSKKRYFHPYGGKSWPKEPPNYIAFRYDGKLQSIHHVEGYEIVTNMKTVFGEQSKDEITEPYIVYKLGVPFSPREEVKSGNIFRGARVWCMLDTLFTSSTISDARDLTEKRLTL